MLSQANINHNISKKTHRLAVPSDDEVRLWQSLAVFDAGDEARGRRLFRSALAAKPRAGEHLRRFLAAGQLPGKDRLVEALLAED